MHSQVDLVDVSGCHNPLPAIDGRRQEHASQFNISAEQYQLLASKLKTEDLIAVLCLLKTHHFRSGFRKKANEKVRAWLDNPKPWFPLSPSELNSLAPTWPVPGILFH